MALREMTSFDDGALPVFPTDSFVGRQSEIEALQLLLIGPETEIVSITGPGGVGKTRLALEVLRDVETWSDRSVAIVALAAAQREEDIVRAIAVGLNIVDHEERLRGRIADTLQERPHLMLLDNLEHLIDGARDTVRWLSEVTSNTRMLATSRIALGLTGEQNLELGPLQTVPASGADDPRQLESVQLFLDRATSSNPRFRLHDGDLHRIAELCRRYDGLPLAIELVASWSNVLSPREMLDRHGIRLEDRTIGRDERHRTLEDAIRWSYELLSDAEQAFFRRMSLFPGGFSRDLAERMIRGTTPRALIPKAEGYDLPWGFENAQGKGNGQKHYEHHAPSMQYHLSALEIDSARAISTLLDHHLILPAEDIDGVLCFDMLETIRAFGLGELGRLGELEGARQSQALTMLAFAEASGNFLWNVFEPRWGTDRVIAAMPSIRSALHWLGYQGEAGQELIVRIAGPLWIVFQTRGLITEGRRWLEPAMCLPEHLSWLQSIELPALAFLCWIQNDDQRAEEVLDEAFDANQRSGNRSTVGLANLVQALVLYRKPEPDLIRILKHVDEAEASFAEWEVPHGLVGCRAIYGIVARMLGDTQQALDLFEEAHRIAIEANYDWGIAITRYFAGETLVEVAAEDETRLPEAMAMMTEALAQTWGQGDSWSAGGALSGLACIRVQRGDLVAAATMFGAASTLMQRVGGSLLPADFLTHAETSERLRDLMGAANYDLYFALGVSGPETVVEQTLNDFAATLEEEGRLAVVQLTNRQMAVLHDLARGYDPPAVARRHGRSMSATYELVDRIAARLGVDTWEQIVPAAVERGVLNVAS